MFKSEESPLEAFMDDDGLLPGDDDFVLAEEDEALEDLLGDEIEDDEDDEDVDEDDEDDEDVDEDAFPEDYLFDIDIDGETYEVNLPELRSGYLRQEELVKRRTALEQEYEERTAEISARESELIREIEALTVQGISDLRAYDNINWEQLKREDPETYQSKRVEFFDAREAVQAQMGRRNQLKSMQEKAAEIKHNAYLQSQRSLVTELLPEFEDPGFQSSLISFAESVGISEGDVRSIADAKQLLVLDMARKYAESQVKRKDALSKKATRDLPEVVRPGTRKAPVDLSKRKSKQALSRLRDEQTLEAASAAFLQFV